MPICSFNRYALNEVTFLSLFFFYFSLENRKFCCTMQVLLFITWIWRVFRNWYEHTYCFLVNRTAPSHWLCLASLTFENTWPLVISQWIFVGSSASLGLFTYLCLYKVKNQTTNYLLETLQWTLVFLKKSSVCLIAFLLCQSKLLEWWPGAVDKRTRTLTPLSAFSTRFRPSLEMAPFFKEAFLRLNFWLCRSLALILTNKT